GLGIARESGKRHDTPTSPARARSSDSARNVPARDQRHSASHRGRRAGPRHEDQGRRRPGPRPDDPRQSPPGGQHCPQLRRQGPRPAGPDRRGQPRTRARRRGLRSHQRHSLQHVRQLLDKQSIKRSLINTAKTIRIPAYMNERLVKWRQAAAKLQDRLGRVPTPDEVGKALRLPKKKIAIMKKAIRVYNAIPQTDHSEVGWSLDEIVTDGNSKPPEDDLIRSDDLTQLANLLKDLDAREADVLRMRFGMTEDSRPRTLTDIGKSMRITRERVRQIERDALDKLREKLRGS